MKAIVVLLLGSLLNTSYCSGKVLDSSKNSDTMIQIPENHEVATLGGGCFWCVEAVFQQLQGIHKVVSGYSGGHVKNPSYKAVTTGRTGHAEVCQVFFDPSIISYEEVLEVFWTTHDPTTLNRQGNDVGPQYRSIILYHNDTQKSIAERSVNEVATALWQDPIVTEIEEFEEFFVAEEYHQDFYKLNPNYGYCRVIINPKIAKVREKFADKLKPIE
jgi:peptide-methionine (S)-S-oxide reductase